MAIMRALLARTSDYGPGEPAGPAARYAQVVYLTAAPARPIVHRVISALPAPMQHQIVVRDLPPGATS